MKYIFAKESEYEEYKLKSNKDNKVRIFWLEVFRSMPAFIKDECKMKMTNLNQQERGKFKITGAVPYQFETQNASKMLSNYLNNFAVFVEEPAFT